METEILICEGYSVNGKVEHWTVECPNCEALHEFDGLFDSSKKEVCSNCGATFKVEKVWIDGQ